jgi:plastocyanin
MKTSMGIILLIVGLVVGGLGSYAMSAGQISSLNSQVSSMQAQITALQGSVSSLQTSLSSSEAQVAALDGQLQALQVPLVTILSCPSTVSVGEHFPVTWNVTGGIPGVITHSAIHLGMSMTDIISVVVSGNTPQTFTATIAAPNQTGTFSIRAHAIVDGTSYFSDLKTITVEQPTSFNLQISADKIFMNKAYVRTITLTVTVTSVNGFNSPVNLAVVDMPPQLASIVSATLNPATITPPANGQATSTLFVSITLGLSGTTYQFFGTYVFRITGTSGSATQSDSLEVILTNPLTSFTETIVGFSFQPSTITVPMGSTVVWTNTDPVTHTITSSRGLFDSGDLPTGQSFVYTFNSTGTFNYYDKYYPSLTGTVIVTP